MTGQETKTRMSMYLYNKSKGLKDVEKSLKSKCLTRTCKKS